MSALDDVLAVTLKGVWLCMKYELEHFRSRGGSIVNNASVAGLVALPGQGAYTAPSMAWSVFQKQRSWNMPRQASA